ncbi:MAG: hypothetical protein AB7O97_03300 [Planctomycetota bacterium]
MASIPPLPLRSVSGLALSLAICGAAPAQVYPYRAIDLGPVPGQPSFAGVTCASISRDGTRIGGTSVWEPYVFTVGAGMFALPKLPGASNALVDGVNDAGFAVGSSGLGTSQQPITACLWDPLGVITPIGGASSWCSAINNQNVVVGGRRVTIGGQGYSHATRWTAATGSVDLTPGIAASSIAHDINDAGQICLDTVSGGARREPGGALTSTGGVVPYAINEYGQMAGKEAATGVAGRWTDGIGWEMFAAGSQIQLRNVHDVNDLGQVVGSRWILQNPSPPSYEKHGYLYTFGLGFQRIDQWVDPAQQVYVYEIQGITDTGRMICDGSIGPDNRALLLEPRYVTPYGSGCGPTGGPSPRLGATGVPAGGGRIALLGAGGHGGGFGVFALASAAAALPLPGGCQVLVDLTAPLTFFTALNPIGQGQVVLDVPPGLPAGALFAQWASVDPAAGPASLSLSNGVRVDLQ